MTIRAMVTMCYFEDGITLKRRTGEIRICFKDTRMCANTAAFGRTISQTDKPRTDHTVASPDPDANSGFPDWEVTVLY